MHSGENNIYDHKNIPEAFSRRLQIDSIIINLATLEILEILIENRVSELSGPSYPYGRFTFW